MVEDISISEESRHDIIDEEEEEETDEEEEEYSGLASVSKDSEENAEIKRNLNEKFREMLRDNEDI